MKQSSFVATNLPETPLAAIFHNRVLEMPIAWPAISAQFSDQFSFSIPSSALDLESRNVVLTADDGGSLCVHHSSLERASVYPLRSVLFF